MASEIWQDALRAISAAPPGEPWTVLIIERQTNPSVLKNLNAALDAEVGGNAAHVVARINPRFRNKPNRVSAALYQSAYLLMFAYFGYEFAFDPRFTKLRQQILDPDAAILPGEFDMPPDAWADALLPDVGQAAVVLYHARLSTLP
jgi:hypothetical protein